MKICSLFSGCGGMDLGSLGGFSYLDKNYSRLKTKIVFACDIDRHAAQVYNYNFKHKAIIGDIKDLKHLIPDHDILISGFPCQSFSILNTDKNKLGYKSKNGRLFFEIADVLKRKQPRVFIVENVKNILSANNGEAFPLIMETFKEAGYHCTYKLLNASLFGIPQKRQRIFIVGFKDPLDFDLFKFPVGTSELVPLKRVLQSENGMHAKYYFSQETVKAAKNTKLAIHKLRAQNIEAPCNTITCSPPTLNSFSPVLKINQTYRKFTPIESARIQSFPEDFWFNTPDTQTYKMIGNAVPPVLMWNIMINILQSMV